MKIIIAAAILLAHFAASAANGPIPGPVTEKSFQITLDKLNSQITPVLKQQYGKAFLATGDWTKEYSKTSAGGSFNTPDKDTWGVHITGWLARWPEFTTDSIEFVLCHELGHHIFGRDAEVQADHFAPKCLTWVWTERKNLEWNSPQQNDLCEDINSVDETTFCRRVAAAFLPVENFRIWVWKPIRPEEGIKASVECRRKAVVLGILGKNSPDCND